MKYIKATDVILGLSLLTLAIAVILLVNNSKYDSAIALSEIIASITIPFITKNLELEKHQKQLLYEKKFEAYSKYFEICDNFWRISGQTVINMHLLNKGEFKSKEAFEEQKSKVLALFTEFTKIRDYLSMPGVGILVFINEKAEKKIEEIVKLDVNEESIIDSKDELENNMKKVEKYIQLISELSALLKEDLGIGVN
jgi:hypothetical protein